MSRFLIFTILVLFTARSLGQTKIFTSSVNPIVSLDGANGSCSIPGSTTPNVFTVSVNGVGAMSSTNQLLVVSIALTDCGTGSKNLNAVSIRLISPGGICYGIYSGGLSTIATGIHYLNLASYTTCLNNPNTSNDPTGGSPLLSSGNNGYFNAQFNGTPTSYSNYTGNLDGTWRVVFSESTQNPPCILSIRLFFGNPNTVTQSGTSGSDCVNAITWDGVSTICGNTGGMAGSNQMPGSAGTSNPNTFLTINGQTCSWNQANNNDVWIKYTATNSSTCLTLSGVSGTNVTLQSIVVMDANVDGDNNPCTQASKTATNDPNWIIASCPRNLVYTTTSGTQLNQQHCFTSVVGNTYYLVIDGDGGASSKFWISGLTFNGVLDLVQQNILSRPQIPAGLEVSLVNGMLKSYYPSTSYYMHVNVYDAIGRSKYSGSTFIKKGNQLDLNDYLRFGMNFVEVTIEARRNYRFSFRYIK